MVTRGGVVTATAGTVGSYGCEDRVSTAEMSPFVQVAKARSVKIKLDRKVLYELDGGDRPKTKSFKVKVEPAAITICVPHS